jgi:lysophospholipid acyltransferase (LPLAT)-like uncharacterized protein
MDIEGVEHRGRRSSARRAVLLLVRRMLELAVAHASAASVFRIGSSDLPNGSSAADTPDPRPAGGTPGGFRAMLRHASAGGDLALTPDAHTDGRVQPGAIALARRTGHALLPVAAAADRKRRVDSWDRFEIPLPGARVLVLYGEPVIVPPRADRVEMEACRRRLEARPPGDPRAGGSGP